MAMHCSILAWRTPWTVRKGKKIQSLEDDPPPPKKMPKGVQYATGEEWRTITDSSRNNEADGPKQKQCSFIGVSGGESKVQCCKEQYCIGTWNVRSVNQDKSALVKEEMTRVNINILGISELKWVGMGEFNSDDHYIYYCGQESLRRNGVALIINKKVPKSVFGCNLKNDRIISICF